MRKCLKEVFVTSARNHVKYARKYLRQHAEVQIPHYMRVYSISWTHVSHERFKFTNRSTIDNQKNRLKTHAKNCIRGNECFDRRNVAIVCFLRKVLPKHSGNF